MFRSLKKLLLVAGLCALPFTASRAFVDLSITVAPPLLPVYEQPPCPVEGYLWTPGYWSYAEDDFFWVPGAWVEPPRIGFLWTPGYWGFADGFYAFHTGYWGPQVGFYGGVNYGFGYDGYGYGGGRWDGGRFRYNTAVTRVNTTVIHNTYVNRSVVNERGPRTRASFNGPGGVRVQATAEQRRAANGERLRATGQQIERRQAASRDRGQFASVNRGRPTALVQRGGRGEGGNAREVRRTGGVPDGAVNGLVNRSQARGLEGQGGGLQRRTNVQQRERADAERRQNRPDGLNAQERQLAERREAGAGRRVYGGRSVGGGYGGGYNGGFVGSNAATGPRGTVRQPRDGMERRNGVSAARREGAFGPAQAAGGRQALVQRQGRGPGAVQGERRERRGGRDPRDQGQERR